MMKNKKIKLTFGTLLVAYMFTYAFVSAVNAQQLYMYVDTQGELQTETAETPTEAIVDADNRMHDSGVMLLGTGGAVDFEEPYTDAGDVLGAYDTDNEVYLYVDAYGNLQSEVAGTPVDAINEADNRKYDSGVMVVTE